ncbi:MAG: ChbG/HpnK family deacetylase [Verrucomicrobia bacterium]|nr:ChbG/HpnK family deacetylase [Verrucomicrobiota bacterium]
MKRFLIVNADDFGLSAGVNRGIIEAHERGIVTSASLMVCQPAAADAVTDMSRCDPFCSSARANWESRCANMIRKSITAATSTGRPAKANICPVWCASQGLKKSLRRCRPASPNSAAIPATATT